MYATLQSEKTEELLNKDFIQLFQINKEDQERYFDLMLSEIERIEAILQEFLSIAKTDEINTEKKNIYRIFKNVVSLMNTKAIMKIFKLNYLRMTKI